jgi:disulfide bond formation protein DsbB
VLAASFLPIAEFSPLVKWILALVAGGAAAGTVHAGTGLLRLASTKTTAGVGNSVVATGENALAVSGTILSFIIPVVVAVVFLLLIVWILRKLFGKSASLKT